MAEYDDPVSYLGITFRDHSDELSRVSVHMDQITALNFVALSAEKDALITAMRALTLCNPESSALTVAAKDYNMGTPASKWAQRELALEVAFVDTVNGKVSRISIPGVDWNNLAGNGDWVDYNNILWTAFKTAFELTARSMYGNPVSIRYGRFIGRRS